MFHGKYRAQVQTKPVHSLAPLIQNLHSSLCLSPLVFGVFGGCPFPLKCPTCSVQPHPLPAPSCCFGPLIFSSTGLPSLTNSAHRTVLPDFLLHLVTYICPLLSSDILHRSFLSPSPTVTSIIPLHQQKKGLLRMDRHCLRTQQIHLEHPVSAARPQMASAQWLHPSLLGAI